MHATFALLLLLTPILAAPRIGLRRPEPVRVPLTAHETRQYHPDLEVRQEWLRSQARGMRRKYARHLGDDGLELLKRDELERDETLRRRGLKRSTGEVQYVYIVKIRSHVE